MSAESNHPASSAPAEEESSQKDTTVAAWLIVLTALLMFWGAVHFDNDGGWFSKNVFAPYRSEAELQPYHQLVGPPDPRVLGRTTYFRPTCSQCHQANGQGAPGQYPPLAGSEWINEPEPGRIIRIVLKGLNGPITVKGQTFNAEMVAWGFDPPTGLTDEEIAAVLTFVRQNAEWGNNAPAVTPERVKAVREKVKNHPRPFNAAELQTIPPSD